MNKLNDKDLREALRRHEAKRLKPQVSEDFCDKVMQALTETDTVSSEQPKRRLWLYPAIGIAAAIALLFSLSVALSHQDGEETYTLTVEHPQQLRLYMLNLSGSTAYRTGKCTIIIKFSQAKE